MKEAPYLYYFTCALALVVFAAKEKHVEEIGVKILNLSAA